MKNTLYVICLILSFVFCGISAHAQVAKIKDGSLANSSILPSENTILELESTSKGFLMPRLTNSQRDAISPDLREEGNGLTIYNIDTDCINYWSNNNKRWMSLCGALPPANIALDDRNCDNFVFVNGKNGTNTLKQGAYLTPEDVLYIDVNVAEVGQYDISAVTDNGYYFTAKGTLMAKGSIRIPLLGVGVPIKGYNVGEKGDAIKFYVNGKLQSGCSNFRIFVEKEGIDFSVICQSMPSAKGEYFINVPVDQKENFIEFDVDVKSLGAYRIQTKTHNGLSFSGAGIFKKTGVQKVKLLAEGMPLKSGEFVFTTETNSNGTINNNCQFNLKVKTVDYLVDLSKTTVSGYYVKGVELLENNYIVVEVKVLAPGKTDLMIKSGNVTFSADNVNLEYKKGTSNIQKVVLYGKGELPSTSIVTFTAQGKFINSFSISLNNPPVTYDIICSSIKKYGTYKVGEEINSIGEKGNGQKSYITVDINVKTPGKTIIYTDEINGLVYLYDGTVKLGKNTITLNASGTPKRAQNNVQFVLQSNDIELGSKCSFSIEVKDNVATDINILVIGNGNYAPSSPKTAAHRILKNPENFGENGIVKVKRIRYYEYPKQNIFSPSDGVKLATYIREKKIDIVLVVKDGRLNSYGRSALTNFVNYEKGVVVYSTLDEPRNLTDFISDVGGGVSSYFGLTEMLHDVTYSSSPIINGPFGDLTSKKLGSDFYSSLLFRNLGSNIIPLANGNDSSLIWAGQHITKGFVFVGNPGWMYDQSYNSVQGPLSASYSGKPMPRYGYGPFLEDKVTVYNSIFFANMMAWAIEYRTANSK